MNKAYTYILYILLLIILPSNALAADPREVRWHNEATDTTTITRILVKATDLCASNPNQLVEFIGREFIGTPYKAGTLEGSPEALTVNLEEMDCTTFVETVVALALTVENHRCSWIDFLDMLETIRYRNGYADGYASRLHYISDWVITNTHRGYIKDVTDRIPQSDVQIKTLDFMSRNRSKYPALSDSATFEGIKNMEVGYRSHRFPYIKSARLSSKPIINALKGGDIVALTTKTNGLDVSHVGILVIEKDGPHLLHASSKEGKVVIDKLPLTEYMRKAHQLTGIRVLRLQAQ
ncbi:N-acetylmuramoyl-L-alanine amidase-like domain-containing protein [Duncaniella muris]|uniref:N-acetylmuramoyl-L-alanine amidase-like domain-containing protein n=1 Tax=Duncaniella muris TaxID=2094150 RepID=UPI002675156E|nr:N-acetylmuramoyl-L-alanine amidase-like domain-containing protein [Duncaniella muris]